MTEHRIEPTRGRARGVAQRVVGIVALAIAVPLGAGALITNATVGTTTTTPTTRMVTPPRSTVTITSESLDVNSVTPRMNARGKANRSAANADYRACGELADGSREARYRCLERSPYYDVPPRKTTTNTHTERSYVSQSPTKTVQYRERPNKAGGVAVMALGGFAGIAAAMGLLLIIGSRISTSASAKHARNWQPTQGPNAWQPHNESTAQFGAPMPQPSQPEPSRYSPQPANAANAAEYPAYAVDSEGDVTPPPPFEVNAPTEPQDTPQRPTDNRPPNPGGSLDGLF